jgi:hypothetical protein
MPVPATGVVHCSRFLRLLVAWRARGHSEAGMDLCKKMGWLREWRLRFTELNRFPFSFWFLQMKLLVSRYVTG